MSPTLIHRLTFGVIGLILAGGFFGTTHTAHASTMTNDGLAELYVVLDLIPEDKKTEALALGEKYGPCYPLTELVEAYITEGLVVSGKEDDARAAVSGTEDARNHPLCRVAQHMDKTAQHRAYERYQKIQQMKQQIQLKREKLQYTVCKSKSHNKHSRIQPTACEIQGGGKG